MALREILTEQAPELHKTCRPVESFGERTHKLLDDMTETLKDSGGVGLAAPQIGILRRAVLVLETNVPEEEDEYIIELINPEIISVDGEQTGPEGCLSVPGEFGLVTRPERVRVRAQDRNGEWFELEGEGLTARAFCHEVDHLDGHLFREKVIRYLTEEELRGDDDEEEIDGDGEQN